MVKVVKKRKGFELKITSLKGSSKGNYIFIKSPSGGYHAFLEVAAGEAARDCGAKGKGNSRQLCKEVCKF